MNLYREGIDPLHGVSLAPQDVLSADRAKRSGVCAVVVTYFPKPQCAKNLAALAAQVDRVIVVDNGTDPYLFEPIAAAAASLHVTVVRLGSNRGIAAALNVGLKFAREQGFKWLATFDQDSEAQPQMIEEIFRVFAAHDRPEKIAVLAPCYVDPHTGVTIQWFTPEATGPDWKIIAWTLTSGSVLNVQLASDLGGFDESLFIDYVDIEFCLRLRVHGYRILQASRATLMHSVGAMQLRRLLTKIVPITNHAPIRRYYIARNRLILWRRYWKQERGWVVRDFQHFLIDGLCVALYEKEAGTKLRMMLRGLRDGLSAVGGEYVSSRR